MGGLGRRHCARTRRLFPRALLNRAGLVRSGRAGLARRHRRARFDRRRRMDAAPRNQERHCWAAQGAYPERAHSGRNGDCLCRHLRGLRALRIHRSCCRLRLVGYRRPRHARCRADPWTRARQPRTDWCVYHTAHRFDRRAKLLGSLSLSCGSDRGVVRTRAGGAGSQ